MPVANLDGQSMGCFARNSSCDIKRHIIQMYFCNKANNLLVEHSPLVRYNNKSVYLKVVSRFSTIANNNQNYDDWFGKGPLLAIIHI